MAGVLVLALGLALGRAGAVGPAVTLVGAAYTAFLLAREEGATARVPLCAAILLLAAELAYWALEPARLRAERTLTVRRALVLALAASGSAALALLVLAASSAEARPGIVLELAGAAAAAGAVGIAVWLLWGRAQA